jgi:hypothetical protein
MKHHSPALTVIPEDEILEEDLKIIRPLNEVKNDNINYHQIIRNHMKREIIPQKPKIKAIEAPAPFEKPKQSTIKAAVISEYLSDKKEERPRPQSKSAI